MALSTPESEPEVFLDHKGHAKCARKFLNALFIINIKLNIASAEVSSFIVKKKKETKCFRNFFLYLIIRELLALCSESLLKTVMTPLGLSGKAELQLCV
jgi:hypothetical protein